MEGAGAGSGKEGRTAGGGGGRLTAPRSTCVSDMQEATLKIPGRLSWTMTITDLSDTETSLRRRLIHEFRVQPQIGFAACTARQSELLRVIALPAEPPLSSFFRRRGVRTPHDASVVKSERALPNAERNRLPTLSM